MSFLGEYTCSIDAKHRLRLPGALLEQIGNEQDLGFVLNRGFEPCLVLYPKSAWQKISAEMRKLNMYVQKHRDFVRYFFRGATELLPDKQQRVLLPSGLMSYAGIEQEAVLFAYFDRIEIWSPQRYEQLLSHEPNDFSELAEQVMGNPGQEHV